MRWVAMSMLIGGALGTAAHCANADRFASVDEHGVLRWQDDGSEIALFGVNYYPPFAIDYKVIADRGLDHKQAIRDDVAHFSRLGLTAIRLHCWDREISDHEGNLIDNEHLELLDYLIAECKSHGIYSVMTPMAWWNSPTGGGFSDLYTMQQMTTDPQAREAQCNYLGQYVNHVNRYTKLAYKDDPAVVAIELINEPLYPTGTGDEQVTEYINALTRAVKRTGCRKPVFYNCWGPRHKAAGASELDGVSFGWYPTGLVAGQVLKEDYLPRVNDYAAMRDEALASKAKIVYEFDAADVHWPYMYPAMARAFRSGGAQIATQFQYDPMCIADGNPTWQTHFLNMAYTPKKALSFAIAAEAFRHTPRLRTFGEYPESSRFGDFRVSHSERLSEMVTRDAFLYSGDTATTPPAPEELTRLWGCGSSPVVNYTGTGAYFLDRLGKGLWQLEVYPDAVMVADPYTGGTHEKVRILWAPQQMTVALPDLGERLYVDPWQSGPRRPQATVEGRTIRLTPGRYILRGVGVRQHMSPPAPFPMPPSSKAPPALHVSVPRKWRQGLECTVAASVAATDVRACELHFMSAGAEGYSVVPMSQDSAYRYQARIEGGLMRPGKAGCYIAVKTPAGVYTFPGGEPGERDDQREPAEPACVLQVAPEDEAPQVTYGGPEGKSAEARIVPGSQPGTFAVHVQADGFGPPPSCAKIDWPAQKLPDDLSAYTSVSFLARGSQDTHAAEISLVQRDGNAFGYDVLLTPGWSEVTVPIRNLRPMWATKAEHPDLSQVEHISVIFGTWLLKGKADRSHQVELQSISLVQEPDLWPIEVLPDEAAVTLVEPATRLARATGRQAQTRVVAGMDPGKRALSISVDSFGPEPDCVAYRWPIDESAGLWAHRMQKATHVIVKARATQPNTDRIELVLIERDGSPWGAMDLPLSRQWQAIRLPLADLRFFAHWGPAARGRGGPTDRLSPANVERVSVCFGAWLYPDSYNEPHGIEIQDISLATE